MRKFVVFILLLNRSFVFGQNCSCDQDEEPIDFICTTITFDNKAQLRWHYSCDSVWLTFEKTGVPKRILYSLEKEMREYAGNLGYIDFYEYKTTFLAESKPISGCCAPLEYDLYNKSTGKLIQSFGTLVHYSEDRTFPVAIKLETRPSPELIITNLESRKQYTFQLPKRDIDYLKEQEDPLFPDEIFESIEQKGNVVRITYTNQESETKVIELKLENYR